MKMTHIKRVFAAVMAAAMLPVLPSVASASETARLDVNQTFDSYVTNEQPDEFVVKARNWYVKEYEEKNKGLLFYADITGSVAQFDASASKDTVISFDLKATDVMPTGEFKVYDDSGRSQTLMVFTESRGAGAYNGLPLSGFGKSRAVNYAIVYRAGDKTCDIYVNGKAKASNMKIKTSSVSNVASVEFSFISDRPAQGVIIDNLNVYEDDKYSIKEFPVNEYNEETVEELEMKFGKQVGNKTLLNEDFNKESTPLFIHTNGNNCKIVKDSQNPENGVYLMERITDVDSHMNASNMTVKTDSIVYEFKVRNLVASSVFNVLFKDSNAVFFDICNLRDGMFSTTVGFSKKLKLNQWYKISIINDYYNRKVEVYVDGELVSTIAMPERFMKDGANLEAFRIHMTGYKGAEEVKFEIDDFCVYESEKVLEELGVVERIVDYTTKDSVFPKTDNTYKKMLSGYTAFHGTSGVVFKDDRKILLDHATYIKKDKTAMLPAEDLATVLGVNVAVNGTSVQFNGRTFTGEIKDGIAYISSNDVISAMGKATVKVPSTYNSHMVIMGNSTFKLPEEQSDIDALNDYLLYYRPDAKEFTRLYEESGLAGVHPRIQFTQADFDRMVELSKTDERMKELAEIVIASARDCLTADPLVHELYDGLRMNCQRTLSKRIHVLAVAYYLTKDQELLDRAYFELETVSNMSDWNPGHHLDTCEMMAAVAVGYDWLYNFFTPEQREVIERGMYNNGYYDSSLAYQTTGSAMGGAYTATNNHGTVDNAAALMAALAFMDAYPAESAYIGSNALRGMELNIYKWAPEGVWYEGAGYWELAMQFTAKWLDTLDTSFKTDLGMGNLEGLDLSVESELSSQSPLGIYNFADAMPQNVYVPEMYYLANKYNVDGVYASIENATGGNKWADTEDMGLAMMWYDPEMAYSTKPLPIDFLMDSIDTIMMRNSWDTAEPTFVGIHAGQTALDHSQLDGGSFIYDNGGVRWAKEMGMGDYNSDGYWDMSANGKRWNHFRSRAEAHSTIITSPSDKPDHIVNSNAEMTVVSQKPRGAIVTVDMTELLYDVNSARRGFAFTDNRESLVIRDEISLAKGTDVLWFMITEADAAIDNVNKTAVLTQAGRQLKVEWASNADVEASFGLAEAHPTSPKQTDNYVPGQYNRLTLKANTSGDYTLTVKLTPMTLVSASPISQWDTSIDSWSIPDGEIPAKPMLDFVYVNGQTLDASKKTKLEYGVVEGEFAVPPAVSASSDIYNVQIIQTDSYDKAAQIIVTDKNDPTNKTVYSIMPNVIKRPVSFPGMTSIPVRGYEVSEISQEENPPINMFDGTQVTRYAVSGTGQWAKIDLGSVQAIDNVIISFMSGNKRRQKVAFSVSVDGINWTEVWKGESCGTTEDFETFNIGRQNARYVRVGLNGNSTGGENWNSVTELVITRNN